MRRPSDHLLRTLAAVPPTGRVLDLGCRDGAHAGALAALGFDVWACSPDPAGVEAAREALTGPLGEDEARRRATSAHSDALGYPDGFFDWVIVRQAAPTREALRAVMEEARRVLKPGGWVWVTAPETAWGGGVQPEALTVVALEAGLALSERASTEVDEGQPVFRGIYRRVERDTAV